MNASQPVPDRKPCLVLVRRRDEVIRIGNNIKIAVRSFDSKTGEVIFEIHAPHNSVSTPQANVQTAEPTRCPPPTRQASPRLSPSGRPTLSLKRKAAQP